MEFALLSLWIFLVRLMGSSPCVLLKMDSLGSLIAWSMDNSSVWLGHNSAWKFVLRIMKSSDYRKRAGKKCGRWQESHPHLRTPKGRKECLEGLMQGWGKYGPGAISGLPIDSSQPVHGWWRHLQLWPLLALGEPCLGPGASAHVWLVVPDLTVAGSWQDPP